MAPKSIYRRPGVQHFQLVHRSQRDPLIHDPEASSHVLKPFQRENDVKKGKSRADLESLLAPEELSMRPNFGEASLYGVYYDDTEYDYMQHLRQTGVSEDGFETIMIEAPVSKKGKGKELELKLPSEALPSALEIDKSQVYDAQQAVPDAIAGFQPDMDPHLRQTLEALEDDAFVDEELEDDFFGELVQDGVRNANDDAEFEYKEEGVEESVQHLEDATEPEKDEPWEVRFARFKKGQTSAPSDIDDSEVDGSSERGDTVGRLPVIGGKRRRKGTESSGLSMTSSAVFRSEGLKVLDECYDQVEKFYDNDEEIPDDDEDDGSDSDEAPDLLDAREDFEAVMDEFLANYELVGRRMQPVLPGDTATEKLDTIRRALGNARLDDNGDEDDSSIPIPYDIDEPKDRWDCETILSTYTNLENHPRIIKARNDKRVARIRLDPRTGLPNIEPVVPTSKVISHEGDEDDQSRPARVTVSRSRDESKEDKKARKQTVKEERQARRVEKKANRDQFLTEQKRQVKAHANKPANVRKL